MDLCELLDLDHTVVAAHAEAYEGYALAVAETPQGSDKQTIFALQSHYLAIAASYWSVAEPSRAEKVFAHSAYFAQRQGKLYENEHLRNNGRAISWYAQAAMLGLSGNESSTAEAFLERFNEETPLPVSTILSVLVVTLRVGQTHPENDRAGRMFSILANRLQNEKIDRLPVGVLQIPLSYYVQLGWMTGGLAKDASEDRIEAWGIDFAKRLDERVSIAQVSRSHWRQLYCRLLPIEPEALLAVAAWWQTLIKTKSDRSSLGAFAGNLSSVMRAYINAAEIILHIEYPRDRPRDHEKSR